MVTVQLRHVWIHDADDKSVFLRFDAFGTHGHVSDWDVEVRSRGVRRQAVGTRAKVKSITVRVPVVAREDWETLEGWGGRKVMYRDPRGRLEYAIFPRLTVGDHHVLDSSVEIDLQVVTHTDDGVG